MNPVAFHADEDRIRAYAEAVHEESPIHYSHEAARAAGFRAIVAPPMFAVVYSAEAVWPAVVDVVGSDLAKMLHGGQEFVWSELVQAGDVITTQARAEDSFTRGGTTFYVFSSVSRNQEDREVVRGTWTIVVRGD